MSGRLARSTLSLFLCFPALEAPPRGRAALVSDPEGGARIKVMGFRAADAPLGRALLQSGRRPVHLAVTLKLNVWQGRESVEMHLKDAAFPEGAQAGERLAPNEASG